MADGWTIPKATKSVNWGSSHETVADPVSYAEDSARPLGRRGTRSGSRPADPTLLGLIRVLTGLMLLYTHAVWGLVLHRLLRRGGVAERRPGAEPPGRQLRLLVLVAGPRRVDVARLRASRWSCWRCSRVGLWTRVTSILALVVTISFAHRVPMAMFGLDQINAMLTLYLAIGPSGQSLSLDRWLAVRRGRAAASRPSPSVGANLALRLINVHMCVIYFFAGVSKLQGEAWWNGEAMWRAFANLEYQSIDMTWLAWHPWLLDSLTHVSVLWEFSFCALIWQPRLRPLVLAGAVPLHVGIGACLGMWTFGLIMLVGCASFLPDEAVQRLVDWLRPRRKTPVRRRDASPEIAVPLGCNSSRLDVREPALVSGD